MATSCGLADSGGSQRLGGSIRANAACPQPWQDLVAPHRPHLARRPRERNDHLPVVAIHPPARCGAVRIGQRLRARQQPCLLQVRFDEDRASSIEQAAQPGFQLGVDHRRSPGGCRDRFAGQIVGRWPEPTREHDEIDVPEGIPNCRGHRGQVVAERGGAHDLDAKLRQPARQVAAVRVPRLAHQQFGADREQHGALQSPSHGRHGTSDRCAPWPRP